MFQIVRTPGANINKGIKGSGVQFNLDPDEFLRGLDTADQMVRGALNHGLKKAGIQLSKDVIDGLPAIPEDTRSLASSGTVFVGNKHVYTTPNIYTASSQWDFAKPEPPTPALQSTDQLGADENTAMVVFNKPYAAKWHENLPPSGAFSRVGAGTKWMSSKLIMNMGKYVGIITTETKKSLERRIANKDRKRGTLFKQLKDALTI